MVDLFHYSEFVVVLTLLPVMYGRLYYMILVL